MGVFDLVFNLISVAALAWVCILFYFALEEYKGGNSFCFSSDNVDKTNQVFIDGYNKVKSLVSPEPFEERELNPHDFDYMSGEERQLHTAMPSDTPGASTDEGNYEDELVKEWLDESVVSQHLQYLKDSNQSTSGASSQVERSDRQDVVPQMGLRRINYGKNLLSPNAVTVPSFVPENDSTSHTNLYKMIGMQ